MRLTGLRVVGQAILIGGFFAAAGTLPWAWLVARNLKYAPAIPWAVPLTAVYLVFFWRFARGDGWPRSTSAARRENSRIKGVSGEVWSAAILAGFMGFGALLAMQSVLARLVHIPAQRPDDVSHVPLLSLAIFLAMSAVVAGVVEEISFRGYLQRPIDQRQGPVAAILVSGTLFGLVHFTHPEVTFALMPYYIAVAAVYGMIAYLTDSVLPSMVLHAGGNMFSSLGLFAAGRSEWEVAPGAPKPLVWESGVDAVFVFQVLLFAFATTITVFAYRGLAQVAHVHRTKGAAGS